MAGSGRLPGEGNGTPLRDSYPGNALDRGAWRATVHGVAKSRTRLSTRTPICPARIWVKFKSATPEK